MRSYQLRQLLSHSILGLTLSLSTIQACQAFVNQDIQDASIQTCTDDVIRLDDQQLAQKDLNDLSACSSQAIPQLLNALSSSDWKIQAVAAYTLGLLGEESESAIPKLSELLKKENPDIRFASTQALGSIGTEQVIPALIIALQDSDENVRYAAVMALKQVGDLSRTAKPHLIDALWDGNWYVRNTASEIISELGFEETDLPRLTKTALDSRSLISLFSAVIPTSLSHPENLISFLISASRNQDIEIRKSAALGLSALAKSTLGHAHLEEIATTLLILSQDSEPRLRQIAVEGLEEARIGFYQRDSIEEIFGASNQILSSATIERGDSLFSSELISDITIALLQAIQDTNSSVRKSAIASLPLYSENSSSEITTIVSSVISALQDPEPGVRKNAITYLISNQLQINNAFEAGDITSEVRIRLQEEVNTEFIKSLHDENEVVRQASIDSATSFNSVISEDFLLSALLEILNNPETDAQIQRTAISALWQNKFNYSESENIVNLLIEFLDSPDFIVRQQAAIALSHINKLDSDSALTIFLEGMDSETPSVRLDAIFGVNKICSANISFEEAVGTCSLGLAALPALLEILEEDFKPLQYAAAFAVAKVDGEEERAIDYLQELLLDEELLANEYLTLHEEAWAMLEIMSDTSLYAEAAYIKSKQLSDKAERYFMDCDIYAGIGISLSQYASDQEKQEYLYRLINNLSNENIRFGVADSLYSLLSPDTYGYDGGRDLLEKHQIEQLTEVMSSQLVLMLNEISSQYSDFPLLTEIFEKKDQDLRRSIIYALGNQSFIGDARIERILTEILNNEKEDLYIRWMTATSLQSIGIDVNWFFIENQPVNPETYQCPFPQQGMTGFTFSRYSMRCNYDYSRGCGAGLTEIYINLKRILSRSD